MIEIHFPDPWVAGFYPLTRFCFQDENDGTWNSVLKRKVKYSAAVVPCFIIISASQLFYSRIKLVVRKIILTEKFQL